MHKGLIKYCKRSVLNISEDITNQQITGLKFCNLLSICLHESTDITDLARLSTFIRYFIRNEIKAELIKLVPL